MLPVMSLWATGLQFFKICHFVELNKIIEATAPMNPYDNHMAPCCLNTKATWNGRYGHLMGPVSPSQAKCNIGIRNLILRKYLCVA